MRIGVPLKGSFKASLKGSIGSIGFRDVQGFRFRGLGSTIGALKHFEKGSFKGFL